MSAKYCHECRSKLTEKELENEGIIPFCPKCNQYRFPMYNVAVSMIVINKETNKTLDRVLNSMENRFIFLWRVM